MLLASKSAIKYAGVTKALDRYDLIQADIDYGSLTSAAQPVGREEGLKCCRQRLDLAAEYCAKNNILFAIAVESYIDLVEQDNETFWADFTAVVFRFIHAGKEDTFVGPPRGVKIPASFQPSLSATDLEYTVGSAINKVHPEVPADDWYKFAGYPHDRSEVIRATIAQAQLYWQRFSAGLVPGEKPLAAYLREHPMTVYPDYPKPGVRFADLFSVLGKPEFVHLFVAECSDIISNLSRHNPEAKICLIGLELRGAILAAMIAGRVSITYVAARKPGNLPGEVVRATYQKEYGPDTLELQKDHVDSFDAAVIVDDLIATGGSMLAACDLCEQLGLSVLKIIAIDDIPSLRLDWQQALYHYNVEILSGSPDAVYK